MNESDKPILVGEFMVLHQYRDAIHVEKLNESVDHANVAEITGMTCHMKVCPENRQGYIAKSSAQDQDKRAKGFNFDCSDGFFWCLSGLFND